MKEILVHYNVTENGVKSETSCTLCVSDKVVAQLQTRPDRLADIEQALYSLEVLRGRRYMQGSIKRIE
jgi:hypothetical protein